MKLRGSVKCGNYTSSSLISSVLFGEQMLIIIFYFSMIFLYFSGGYSLQDS